MFTAKQKARCVLLYAKFKPATQIQHEFAREFNVQVRDAPSRGTIIDWHRKFVETGSVKDRNRSGRPGVSEQDAGRVQNEFQDSPALSLRRASERT